MSLRKRRKFNIPLLMTTGVLGGGGLTPLQEAQALIDGIGSTIKRAWFTHLGTMNQDSSGSGDPVASNSDPVAYIPDLSTANDPLTQSTTANKGLYRPTGVNGFPGIEIVTDDFYSFTLLNLSNFTIFAVADLDTPTAADYLIGGTSTGLGISAGPSVGCFALGGGGLRGSNAQLLTPEIYTATNAHVWVGGVEVTYTGTPSTLTSLNALANIGRRADNAALRFNGKFGAIIIADTQLSNTNLNALGEYLAGIYGKTWTAIT